MVDPLDLVEVGVGIQGVQLLPGQPAAGRDPVGGVGASRPLASWSGLPEAAWSAQVRARTVSAAAWAMLASAT